jgi:disulfide bond formation protein DsbB
MYPLAFVFLVGAFKGARSCFSYALPIAVAGWIIALYHNLLHYGIVPESASPCMQGVSCATVYVNWFGFITIPILSFTAFSIILVLLFLMKRTFKNEK